MHKLYTAQTANDTSAGNAVVVRGGELGVHSYGTWDGASMVIKLSNVGAGSSGITEITATADDYTNIQVPAGVYMWAELSSAGGSTSVSCWVAGEGVD